MSVFAEEIYPLRTNRAAFAAALLTKVDANWSQVTAAGGGSERPGDVQRCRIEGSGFRCDYAPVFMDKKRVKAVLQAFARQISDRYLDLQSVNVLDHRSHESEQAAFDALRQNAPRGAVRFIFNELAASRSPYFFGPNLWQGWGYNEYFSALLHWDDRHVFGLINALRREQGRYGAGGTPGHLWAATRRWIVENQRNGVYQATNVRA